jgi:hypothetical protein
MWTFALTVTGLGGLWLVARHWQGWILYLINELLWLVYGVSTGQHPVIVMAVLWFILGARNLVVTRRSQHAVRPTPDLPVVQPELRDDDGDGDALAVDLSVMRAQQRLRIDADEWRSRPFWRPY